MNRWLIGTAALALLAGCGGGTESSGDANPDQSGTTAVDLPPPSLETGGPRAETNMTAAIDWQAARADLAGSEDRDGSVVQVQSGGSSPPVPVLLPSGLVVPQSEGGGPTYRPTSDGYFATYPGLKYDVVVNGTNQVATINGEAASRDDEMIFTSTEAGAHVAISRYGADYLIEFECNTLDDGIENCIDEAEALSVAERLVVVGSR
ncbi:MAG: hypothetical protein AAFS13_02635 [Pseudomonadota bacterium]